MIPDWYGVVLTIALIGCMIMIWQNSWKIAALKHDVFVLSQMTGRFDIYKEIVFKPVRGSASKVIK